MRDPNRLTGLTEAELDLKAKLRRKKDTHEFIKSELLGNLLWSVLTIVIILVIVAGFFNNWPNVVARFGGLLVATSVYSTFVVSAKLRADREQQIVEILIRETAGNAEVEANKAIRRAFPDAYVTRLAGGSVAVPLNNALASLERPFALLELFLGLIGTLLWAFGDWVVSYLYCGSVQC